MEHYDKGQVNKSAAEIYESFFVPALFGAWAGPTLNAAGAKSGDKLLDVACGTGVVAREAARRLGDPRKVVALDCNEGMLTVARRTTPQIAWQSGHAENLPFDDKSFDIVTCQFGLMFFDNRLSALEEMWRVLKPGGRLVVTTWDKLAHSPGYAAMVALLQEMFGESTANALRAPFAIGEAKMLSALAAEAGIAGAVVETHNGTASFPSLEAWVQIDVKGWTLADMIDDTQFEALLDAARNELTSFARADGTVSFAAPAHILAATRP